MTASKAQKAATAKRREQATALKLAGMDWQTIADRLGYSDRAAACKDVSRALEANLTELRTTTEEMRAVEALRLDRLQAAVWGKAITGDGRAVETVLRVMDRRMRLLKLDQTNDAGTDAARSMLGALADGIRRIADTAGEGDSEEG